MPSPPVRLRLNDRFELKAQAGAGGMGTVYKAVDRRAGGALVAVKILNVRNVTDVARFLQEAALLRELSHPGIVRYVDHGVTSHGDPFIAMEWLEGETLEQRLVRGPLPAAGVTAVAGRVLEGLAEAHGRGIIHRDLKPSNIFLVGWRLLDVRLLDFGVARRLADPKRFTSKGATVGTPQYTAPEQARGEATVDGRADIFSLGCVLFECVSGRPPFVGTSAQDVMSQICLRRAPPLREYAPQVNVELAHLIDQMLQQEPRHRPADARALAKRFRALTDRLSVDDGGRSHTLPLAPPVETLGYSERRVLCGVLVAFEKPRRRPTLEALREGERLPPRRAGEVVAAGTIVDGRLLHEVHADSLRRFADDAGANVERLARGSFIMTPTAAGPLSDQVRQMAQLALKVAWAHPGARLCVGVGRAMVLAGLPVGDLVERLPDLVPDEPGRVCIDATAARLLPPRIRQEQEQGRTYLLDDEQTEATLASVDGRASPFLGRDRELTAVLGTLDECADEGVARAMLFLAGPGAGKTRLARELTARARGSDRGPAVFSLRARPERTTARFALLTPLLVQARVEAGDEIATPLVLAQVIAWLEALAKQQPVVVVVDDLQWADRSSLELLDLALRELRHQPLLVVGLARPELDEHAPGLWRERNVERSRLAPLSRRTGQQLLRTVMPGAAPEAEDFVLQRWEGNPGFLTELALAYAPQVRLAPDTILGVVEARFASLDEEPRRVLRAASVFGESFEPEAVLALVGEKVRGALDECLAVLVEKDLVRPHPGATVYSFRNELVREAAFAMLSPSDRALAESRARQWLETHGKTLPECLVVRPSPAAVG